MDNIIELPARHKLTVDEYHQMADAGIFGENHRIELIDGDLIDMAPIGQGHMAVVNGLNRALVLACGDKAIVSPQNSVRLDRSSAPQPDFAILRPRADFYAIGERAGAADVFLLVEVADSSLTFDRTVKLPLYAKAGIPEYWIVDLRHRTVEAYRSPSADGYGQMTTHKGGDRLALAAAPDIVVELYLVFG